MVTSTSAAPPRPTVDCVTRSSAFIQYRLPLATFPGITYLGFRLRATDSASQSSLYPTEGHLNLDSSELELSPLSSAEEYSVEVQMYTESGGVRDFGPFSETLKFHTLSSSESHTECYGTGTYESGVYGRNLDEKRLYDSSRSLLPALPSFPASAMFLTFSCCYTFHIQMLFTPPPPPPSPPLLPGNLKVPALRACVEPTA